MNMTNFIKCNNKQASVPETHTVLKISTKHNETNVGIIIPSSDL